jgi:hypothetical protein
MRFAETPDFKLLGDAAREPLELSATTAGLDDFGSRLAEKR